MTLNRLRILLPALLCLLLAACAGQTAPPPQSARDAAGSMELQYANQFAADYYEDGSALVTIAGEERFLVLPQGAQPPEELGADVTLLRQPLHNIYLASSSAMDLFRGLDALGAVRMTSTAAPDWTIPQVRQAVEQEDILYVGKYGAPDYELILDEGCDLAVENTMIYHKPETLENLQALGIPTLVERSSYESHPLGRLEWIKLYGLLTGKEDEAAAFFDAQVAGLSDILTGENTGKTAAFFYITNSGAVNVRKPGDYVSKMIELAGGINILSGLPGQDDNALSTINMQMEAFYAQANQADILIYNSTVGVELSTIGQLLEKSALLADFKAVREGNVWCTNQNMFQQTTGVADTISDLHAIFTGAAEAGQLTFLHQLT